MSKASSARSPVVEMAYWALATSSVHWSTTRSYGYAINSMSAEISRHSK
jgi:hypothetical protein